MGRRRSGWVRKKKGAWYVGFTLRSGKPYEKLVPPPPDGLPVDKNYLALVRSQLVREYESGAWDPEASEVPVEPAPENPTFVEHLRHFAKSRTYESAAKDRSRVDVYLAVSPIAEVRVRELKPAHALALIAFLKERPSCRGGTLGSSAVRSIFDVCQRALDMAIMRELLPSNPFRLGPVRAELPRKRHKDPKARKGWWFRREEVAQLLTDPRVAYDRRVMYALLFLTGMRFGELAALRFGDWDRAAQPLTRITVSLAIKSVSKTEGATKTEAEKQVPVHPVLESFLAAWFERGWARYMGRAPTAEDYVLPSMRGRRKGRPRNGSTSNRTFRDDCEELKLRSRHMYCARHTFITLTQEDGGDGTVLRWITHAPPSTAYDGYSREQWGRLCREIIKFQFALPAHASELASEPPAELPTELAEEGDEEDDEEGESEAENTLDNTLDRGGAISQTPLKQGDSGGSTEESNLPRDAEAPTPPVLKTGPVTRPGRASEADHTPRWPGLPTGRRVSYRSRVGILTTRSSLVLLLSAFLAEWGCRAVAPPRAPVALAPPVRVRRFRMPRASCEPPALPNLEGGWTVVGWPTVPRFISVEAEGAVLYATTTSSVCRSLDGGRRWEAALQSLDAPNLIAVDGARIVVRAEESWEGSDDVASVWWVSENGGVEWQRHERPPEVGQGRMSRILIRTRDVVGEYAAVSCGDAFFALVPAARGRGPRALRSEDGGMSWAPMLLPRALRQPGVTFRCIGHDAVVLERGGAVPTVTAFSRDRGEHWESIVRVPLSVRVGEPEAFDDVSLPSSGCAPLAGSGVFCEVRGQGWASADRGRRWHRADSPVGGRAVPMHGEFLLGVGGGVVRSTDAGRQWEIVTVAPGRANLGFRGGILSPGSYWLAGSALWWTDDGGERWSASQLPWELVAVLGRDRWVGLRPQENRDDSCGTVMLTLNRGASWRPSLPTLVKRMTLEDGELHAFACDASSRVFASRDAVRWRPIHAEPPPEADAQDDAMTTTPDGTRVELHDAALRVVDTQGHITVVATSWPRDVVPVAASTEAGALRVVVFGNGTVIRRM